MCLETNINRHHKIIMGRLETFFHVIVFAVYPNQASGTEKAVGGLNYS